MPFSLSILASRRHYSRKQELNPSLSCPFLFFGRSNPEVESVSKQSLSLRFYVTQTLELKLCRRWTTPHNQHSYRFLSPQESGGAHGIFGAFCKGWWDTCTSLNNRDDEEWIWTASFMQQPQRTTPPWSCSLPVLLIFQHRHGENASSL